MRVGSSWLARSPHIMQLSTLNLFTDFTGYVDSANTSRSLQPLAPSWVPRQLDPHWDAAELLPNVTRQAKRALGEGKRKPLQSASIPKSSANYSNLMQLDATWCNWFHGERYQWLRTDRLQARANVRRPGPLPHTKKWCHVMPCVCWVRLKCLKTI